MNSSKSAVTSRDARKSQLIAQSPNGWKFTGFKSPQKPMPWSEKYYRVFVSPSGAEFLRHTAFPYELTMVVGKMLRVAADAKVKGDTVDALKCIEEFLVQCSHRI